MWKEWCLGLVKRGLDDYRAANRLEVRGYNFGVEKGKDRWVDKMANTAYVRQGRGQDKLAEKLLINGLAV